MSVFFTPFEVACGGKVSPLIPDDDADEVVEPFVHRNPQSVNVVVADNESDGATTAADPLQGLWEQKKNRLRRKMEQCAESQTCTRCLKITKDDSTF